MVEVNAPYGGVSLALSLSHRFLARPQWKSKLRFMPLLSDLVFSSFICSLNLRATTIILCLQFMRFKHNQEGRWLAE